MQKGNIICHLSITLPVPRALQQVKTQSHFSRNVHNPFLFNKVYLNSWLINEFLIPWCHIKFHPLNPLL